jgi:hypothetical protein
MRFLAPLYRLGHRRGAGCCPAGVSLIEPLEQEEVFKLNHEF